MTLLLDAELDERRILLERGAEEHLAGQEHDDEVGAATGCRRNSSCAASCVRCVRTWRAWSSEQRLTRRFVGRLERPQVRVERRLGVDDDVLAAGQPDDDVGPDAGGRLSPLNVCCSSKSQCSSMPASSTTRFSCSSPQRPRTPGRLSASTRRARFGAQVLARRVERRDPLHQLRAGLDAPALGVLDLAIDLIERLRHRREQILDRLLARVDVGGRFGARFAQPRFGEIEKCPVVGLERLGAESLEGVAEAALRLPGRP